MSQEFPSTAEPQTPEECLRESHKEKFSQRFLWIMQKHPEVYNDVVQKIGEEKGVVDLYQFFMSDDSDVASYANKLGVLLEKLISSEFISQESFFDSYNKEE